MAARATSISVLFSDKEGRILAFVAGASVVECVVKEEVLDGSMSGLSWVVIGFLAPAFAERDQLRTHWRKNPACPR